MVVNLACGRYFRSRLRPLVWHPLSLVTVCLWQVNRQRQREETDNYGRENFIRENFAQECSKTDVNEPKPRLVG